MPFRNRQVETTPRGHLHNNPEIPLYSKSSRFHNTTEILNIILDPELDELCVCSQLPFGVDCNSVFLVDMTKLRSPRDIVCDDMGSWKWGGSYRMWLSLDETGFVAVIGKAKPDSIDPELSYFRIWKRYYENKSSSDLKKIIVTIEGKYYIL